MKKTIEFGIFLFIVLLIYQFVVIFLENNHIVKYDITINDEKYIIEEEYVKNKNINGYYLTLKSEDNDIYTFFVDNKYNKQKKIVKDIKVFEKDGYKCLYPVVPKKDKNLEILCSKKHQIYSAASLYKKVNMKEFISEFEDTDKYIEDNKTPDSMQSTYFYSNNIFENEYYALYKYKSLYLYNREKKSFYQSLYPSDVYDNSLAAFIDYYYICPEYNSGDTTDNFIMVNIKTGNKRNNFSEFSINYKKSYPLGIVDNKFYFMDLSSKTEYSFNTKGSMEVEGTTNNKYKYYNQGVWEDKTITEFETQKIKFNTEIDMKKHIDYDEIYETDKFYYIIKDNKVYKVYKNNYDSKIYLFSIKEHSNVFASGDNLYYISGNTIYKYDKYGHKKILFDDELKYHKTANTFYAYVE